MLDVPRQSEAAIEGTLPSLRDAEVLEALRDGAEARAAGGHRPRIVLTTLGEPAAFGARATAAANLLAAVGIATGPLPNAARDLAELAEDFRRSGARGACICGDDGAYARDGESCVTALRRAGAAPILVFDGAIGGSRSAFIRRRVHDPHAQHPPGR